MKKTGILGCGNMGSALAAAIAKAGNDVSLLVYDVDAQKSKTLAGITGAVMCDTQAELVENADTIILAVKPQQMDELLSEKFAKSAKGKLIVSIAAGVSIKKLEKALTASRIIRVMPNTPALIGKGVIAFSAAENCTDADTALISTLLTHAGMIIQVPESSMNAITGLSGSGPAYVFMFINALAEGGVGQGLSKADALKIAAQTVAGSAELVIQSGTHPELLKDKVTSPGGTTINGLAVLEDYKFRSACIQAVTAASLRAAELDS